jgi:hypothetical protein
MHWWFVWLSNWTACSAYRYVLRATHGLESLWRSLNAQCLPSWDRPTTHSLHPTRDFCFPNSSLLLCHVLFVKDALCCLSQSSAVVIRPTWQSFQRNIFIIRSLFFNAFDILDNSLLSKCLDQPRFNNILIICVASIYLYILFKYYIVNKKTFVVFNIDFLAVNFKLT